MNTPSARPTTTTNSPIPNYTTSTNKNKPPQLLSRQQQVRALHATRRQENLVVGGLVVAGTALALQYGLRVRARLD